MKIIGGKLKGKRIDAPRGLLSRPPLAIIRESVFNALGDAIRGARVLDLFAGSGSLGIESLSRGASYAHFVDNTRRCFEMIRRNLEALELQSLSDVVRQDAVKFILDWRGEPFDIIFIDPPFLSGKAEDALRALASSSVSKKTSIIIARIHKRERIDPPAGLSLLKQRRFGDSLVLFLKKEQSL